LRNARFAISIIFSKTIFIFCYIALFCIFVALNPRYFGVFKMKRLGFWLNNTLYQKLVVYARDNGGISIAAAIRQILSNFLKDKPLY